MVVQYESKIKDKWYPIVRYDCSHGFFHRDILNQKRREDKTGNSDTELYGCLNVCGTGHKGQMGMV